MRDCGLTATEALILLFYLKTMAREFQLHFKSGHSRCVLAGSERNRCSCSRSWSLRRQGVGDLKAFAIGVRKLTLKLGLETAPPC
jgi:hypothetical protein